ncbi:hypothetical protein K9N68_35925 (plasmid) [Kovacikia minuta CCNUW1]|uniref:hypothetical protein n=1 Tax=Kovacikia minuta TaxID=2931930 RepID=UPI001CC9F5CC|nr:hypothetical protein [Kovacikia minuta]UBF30568.1 hypothetical protein K9N68_35925 [Kovacikia minuta CCNUW1]
MQTLIKVVLITLLFVMNLAIAQPSLADPPKVTKNPDYIELSKSLDNLLAEKETKSSPELQQRIDELQLQKSVMESGITWGQCRNETGKTLAVYGPKAEKSKSSFDNALYFLANGQSTPDGWDCNGIYLPNGTKVAGADVSQPLAYKVLDGTQLVAKTNPDTSEIVLNVPPASVFKAGEANWSIPDVSQAFIDSRIPSTLTVGEIDD